MLTTRRRRALALLLTLAVAVVTWARAPRAPVDLSQRAGFRALPREAGCCAAGPFRLTGAWQVTSPNQRFGGYSALLLPVPGRMLALSDAGYMLDMPLPGSPPGPVRIAGVPGIGPGIGGGLKQSRDVEAAVRDPGDGTVWIALEGRNAVLRLDAALAVRGQWRVAAMRRWPANTGAEAMVRLADGRFIVLCECDAGWSAADRHPALLFAGDPAAGLAPVRFAVRGLPGYRPTDMAELPDGRLLVLMRRLVWPFPARFAVKLALVDPAGIAPGRIVQASELADLAGAAPLDNYEGLALAPGADGTLVAWIISDDNAAALQRTLLLRLEFRLAELPPKDGPSKDGRGA